MSRKARANTFLTMASQAAHPGTLLLAVTGTNGARKEPSTRVVTVTVLNPMGDPLVGAPVTVLLSLGMTHGDLKSLEVTRGLGVLDGWSMGAAGPTLTLHGATDDSGRFSTILTGQVLTLTGSVVASCTYLRSTTPGF